MKYCLGHLSNVVLSLDDGPGYSDEFTRCSGENQYELTVFESHLAYAMQTGPREVRFRYKYTNRWDFTFLTFHLTT